MNENLHRALVAQAGEDFAWAGVRGCGRPTSKARAPFRAWLAARQGNVCPVCGDAIKNAEFNHVISRGPANKGWVVGNIFAGCAACNTECKERGPIVAIADMARPDVIVTDYWPRMTDMARNS